MIETLVIRVFAARNAAHIEHWRTKSFAKHQSLGDFYNNSIESIDALVEAYQGVFKLIKIGDIPKQVETKNIIEHLEDDVLWICENRKEITKEIPVLENLMQNLECIYITTLYKLKNLD